MSVFNPPALTNGHSHVITSFTKLITVNLGESKWQRKVGVGVSLKIK
jgi:hypothetical protein